MRNFFALIFSVAFSIVLNAQNDTAMGVKSLNFTSFYPHNQPSQFLSEYYELIPSTFQNHPEFGSVPFNSGLDSAIELIDQRTEYTRSFVKAATNGKTLYTQKGFFPLHFLDNSGRWITFDPRLQPSQNQSGLYEAPYQYSPTSIDVIGKYAAIRNGSNTILFNNNLVLYYDDFQQNRTVLGPANWTNYTAGNDGVYVTDAWQGIDIQMIVSDGAIKTNFLVKNPVNYSAGYFVFSDQIDAGTGSQLSFTNNTVDLWGNYISPIEVRDLNNNIIFTIGEAIGYDQSNNRAQNSSFGYRLNSGRLEMYVPVSWLSNPMNQFPLVIDPLVSSSGTRLQGAIGGSGLNNSGAFTNSCNYNLSVPTPTNCTITNILWSFNYRAQNGAVLCDGGLDFQYGTCRSPSAPGFYWFCNNCVFAGTCTGTNISIFSDFSSCIPAPQCPSYNMNFTMRFYDRWAGPACSNFFIAAWSNWVMTIEGQTVNQPTPPVSSNGTTICLGSYTTLTATGTYGVPGYTYLWSPGGQTTQSITVAPTTTTTYTCLITDACGQTASNTVTITVNTVNTLTPLPTFSVVLSPASGNPCPVTATVTYTGTNNYGGGAENYQWSFGGSSAVAPAVTSGSANAPPYGGPYTVTYTTPGSYALSVTIVKSPQCAVATQTITICGALPVELLDFNAEYLSNKTVLLNWTTATELNCSHFIVERTTDGFNFTPIGRINSQAVGGNSSQQLNYSFTDATPFVNGTSYYRLREVDLNGNETTSSIVSIEIHDAVSGILVQPNPVADDAMISFNAVSGGEGILTVIDYTGKVVFDKVIVINDGMNAISLSMSQFNSGIYFVRIAVGSQFYQTKFIKR